MSRIQFLLVVLVIWTQSVYGGAACGTLETIEDGFNYNILVCSGEKKFRLGLYKEAIEQYSEASKIKFLDYPNYRLNTKIAHSYLLLGDLNRAEHYLEKSRIILKLLAGTAICEENESTPFFQIRDKAKVLESPASIEVSLSMCGAAYDSIYSRNYKTAERTAFEKELEKYYMHVVELFNVRRQ